MENVQRITSVSRRLRLTCTGLLFGFPLLYALFWIFFNQIYFYPGIRPSIPLPVPVDHHLNGQTRFLAFTVGLIPLAVTLYGLQKLRELFTLYEVGSIFTEGNVKCLRSLGRILIVWVGCSFVRWSLLSIVLTLENPPGQRMLVVGLNGEDFIGVFVGVVVLAISRVMDEARKIEEDQALIV
ncbi:MAG: DUF2975 domain-containing protein [Pseudomonadota bacterium]